MRASLLAPATAVSALFCSAALAGDLDPAQVYMQDTAPLLVVPRVEVPIRTTPPGFFQFKGDQIGTTEPDQRYLVLERRAVPSILGTEEWLLLQPISPNDAAPSGWSYGGRWDQTDNFVAWEAQDLLREFPELTEQAR